MDIRLIDSFDALLKLRKPWNELASQTPDDHAYMRHEWFEHWLSTQEMNGHLHMITCWQDRLLVGVIPLVWKDLRLRGLNFRALGFAESPVSARCNALTLTSEALGGMLGHLASERRCQLFRIPTRSFSEALEGETGGLARRMCRLGLHGQRFMAILPQGSTQP